MLANWNTVKGRSSTGDPVFEFSIPIQCVDLSLDHCMNYVLGK